MADLASQPTSVQSAYGWHAESRIYVNRRYQRKLVWTLEEKQKLIESILKKYPIPAILLAERKDDVARYEIIDGLQRLNAIVSFIEGAFATLDGKYFDVSAFPTARARKDEGKFVPTSQEPLLDPKEVSTVLDYTIAISIMRKADENEIDDVFDRINSYGHRLSDQERRQSGIQDDFSDLVRKLACKIRGDDSPTSMLLEQMPEISIDLPMTKHGYDVKAEEVFWVNQGILRATDLRDSMDEQCIADIAASIISGAIVERSKDALDTLYQSGTEASNSLLAALKVYGADVFADEFGFCVEQISNVCNHGSEEKLRNIIYEHRTTNAFPAVFSVIFIAFHELFIKHKKAISDIAGVKGSITNLTKRIDTSRRATSPDERQKNVDVIKALITPHFVEKDISASIYANHSSLDVDTYIRRSGMELSHFELKQGIVSLNSQKRELNKDLTARIVETICAMANNGPQRSGKLIIGVADIEADAQRIQELDGVASRKIGDWYVVGIKREAKALGVSLEDYHGIIRDFIEKSKLSDPLKTSVLSNIEGTIRLTYQN